MKKLAIVGASYLQEPLIECAKANGIETHVFAWKANDIGEKTADFFYPISITEKEQILGVCKTIGIDGITSIASDLAMHTVNYVAEQLNLPCNSIECTNLSTNKHAMRMAFEANHDPSPKSFLVEDIKDLEGKNFSFPVIVKPTDRSGSRGITKLYDESGLREAILAAKEQSFESKVLVEEYLTGQEYSVEYLSYRGKHTFLALTKKFTTGSPHFIETGHLQPAPVSKELLSKIQSVVEHALTTLKIQNGASHTEIKIQKDGSIGIVEIGGRMGGDCIGSSLVPLTTGIDFVKAVMDVALGKKPDLSVHPHKEAAMIHFIFSSEDVRILESLRQEHPEYLVEEDVHMNDEEITDSSNRFGYFIAQAESLNELQPYLPKESYEE